jgi:hypothetical protein
LWRGSTHVRRKHAPRGRAAPPVCARAPLRRCPGPLSWHCPHPCYDVPRRIQALFYDAPWALTLAGASVAAGGMDVITLC